MLVPIQARLVNGQDEPVTGAVTLKFSFYTRYDDEPGNPTPPVWSATYNVRTSDGVFSVLLGDKTDTAASVLPETLFDGSGDRYLGVTVGTETELRPRLKLGSVPAALLAKRALDADRARQAANATEAEHAEKATDSDKLGGKLPSAYAEAVHGHAISETTGLQAALDGKAAASHAHPVAEVTGLQAALDGRAAATHTHTVADTTGLQAELDGKAAVSHTHAIANVTGLQAALDGKAASVHTHAQADVTGLGDLAAKVARLYSLGEFLYESETLSTENGTELVDVTASGGKTRKAGATGTCMQFGPYTADQPPGHYRAVFRLKGTGTATIDAVNPGGTDGVNGAKKVTVSSTWAEYQVKFVRGSAGTMEYRVCSASPGVIADYVRIVRDNAPGKPRLKISANAYTIAEARTLAGPAAPGVYGNGNVCEVGYHICNFIEAVALKYTNDEAFTFGTQYLRTAGTYSALSNVGVDTPHNSVLGYYDGGAWNGSSSSLRCPANSGPMVYFENRGSDAANGHSWTGGCYADDKRNWACCQNLDEQ